MHVEELRKEKGKEFALLEDKELSTLEKLAILRDLQAELYKKEGYKGTLPRLYVTDGPNSFAVDGKGKRIFISVQDLESGKGLASLYAHENVHLYSGYENGEHLAEYGEAKVSKESSKEKFTEEERRAYLEKVKGRVEQAESLEKQFAMANEVSEEDRENYEAMIFEGRIMATVIGIDAGIGIIYHKDSKTGEEQFGRIENIAGKIGVSSAIEGGWLISSYSKPNAPIKDFSGYYGGVRASVGYGLNGSYEFRVNKDEGEHGGDLGIGSGISFSGYLGKREVILLENLSKEQKSIMRSLLTNKNDIVNTYDFYNNLSRIRGLMR